MSNRFESKINKRGPVHLVLKTRCWLWTRFKDKDGYGKYQVEGKSLRSHRFSYELYVGPIPDGMLVCHACDNPSCVNPDHLFLGTHRSNVTDKVRKRRQARGEGQGSAILTELEVKEMRKHHLSFSKTRGGEALAKKYGVSATCVYEIIRRENWKHI